MVRYVVRSLLSLTIPLLAYGAHAVVLEPGDLVVTDGSSLVLIDPTTGDSTVLTPELGGGDIEQDPTTGDIIVVGASYSVLYRFTPSTGDFGVLAQGGFLADVTALSVDAEGRTFVGDRTEEALIQIDPDGSQGLVAGGFFLPEDVAVEPSGTVLVANETFQGPAYFIRVDPQTGSQTTVASGFFDDIDAFALEPSGTVVTVGSDSDEGVVRFDLAQETKTPVADGFFVDVVRAADGQLYAVGGSFGPPGVTRIDSDGSLTPVGNLGVDLESITEIKVQVVPEPNSAVLRFAAILCVAAIRGRPRRS